MTLVSHRERIALLDQLQLRVDQLLHLAGRCEASLHRTRIELAAIRTGSAELGRGERGHSAAMRFGCPAAGREVWVMLATVGPL